MAIVCAALGQHALCTLGHGAMCRRWNCFLALQLLLGPGKARLAGAWDIDPELQPVHEVIHGAEATRTRVHLGQPAGDILATDLANFPDANILVAGPPCPPFSSCGKRMALEDTRSQPFTRCVEVIAELDSRARRGTRIGAEHPGSELMFFLLENVPGIAFSSGSQAPQSPWTSC